MRFIVNVPYRWFGHCLLAQFMPMINIVINQLLSWIFGTASLLIVRNSDTPKPYGDMPARARGCRVRLFWDMLHFVPSSGNVILRHPLEGQFRGKHNL